MSASETGSASESTPLLPDEYEGLIERRAGNRQRDDPAQRDRAGGEPRGRGAAAHRPAARAALPPGRVRALRRATTRRTATPRSRSSRACARAEASTCCCRARRSGGSTTTRGSATTSSATTPRSCPADDCIVFELARHRRSDRRSGCRYQGGVRRDVEPAARRAAGRAPPGAAARRRQHRRGHPGRPHNCPLRGLPCRFRRRRLRPARGARGGGCRRGPVPGDPRRLARSRARQRRAGRCDGRLAAGHPPAPSGRGLRARGSTEAPVPKVRSRQSAVLADRERRTANGEVSGSASVGFFQR